MTKTECISETALSSPERTIDIKTFYQRLAGLGFPRKFVREVLLPDWWCDEFEQQKGAVCEAAAHISRRTNLDFAALLDAAKSPFLREEGNPLYKLRQGTEKSNLLNAQVMAQRVAELAAYAFAQPLPSFEIFDAQTVRKQILSNSQFVTLESLLIFCGESGIPVVHTNCFPKGTSQKKFDGMVGEYNDRPVILIGKNHQSAAWLAFIVAHELGHIICGHVKDFSIIDQKIEPNEEGDLQELEADQFAIEVLFGRKDASYDCPENLNPQSLGAYATAKSKSDTVVPGLVILNYAWFKAKKAASKEAKSAVWKIANKALAKIEAKNITASKLINHELQKRLVWEILSDDNQEFLARMTGIEVGTLASH
jgi:Zn-dependent peptidase ImmA (M78 family)